MFCSKCGKEVSAGSQFCASCGTPMGGTQPLTPPPQAIPPTPPLPVKKKSGCLKWVFGILGILILLGIIGSCAGGSSDKKTSTPAAAPSASSKPAQTPQEPQYNFTVTVDGSGKIKGTTASDVGVAIAEIKTMNTIDGPYTSKKAQGIFKVILVVVKNGQKDAVTLDANSFKLIDEQNREFSHSVEGDMALQMSNRETLFLKSINPGITATGFISYDVPPDAKIKSLQFKGGMSGKKGELPFRIITE